MKIFKSFSFVFAAIINLILFWLVYRFLEPGFQTNDDTGMMLSVAGVVRVIEPTPYLLFTHFLVGKLLIWFYENWPREPWYAYYLITGLYLSYTAILSIVLRRKNTILGLVVYLLFFLLLGIDLLQNLQFTVTSSVLVISGFILFFDSIRKKKSVNWVAIAGGVILVVIGSLVRWNSFLLFAGLLIPILALSSIQVKARAILFQRLIGPVLAVVIALIFHQIEIIEYSKDEGWEKYRSFNALKSKVIDYGYLEGLNDEDLQPILEQGGWSLNDYQMMRTWAFFDPEIYNEENLGIILNQVEDRRERPSFGFVLSHLRDVFLSRYGIGGILFLFITISVTVPTRKQKIEVFFLLGAVLMALVFMAVFLKPAPLRLQLPLLLTPGFYALATFKRISFNRETLITKRGIFITLLLVASVAQTIQFTSVRNYVSEVNKRKERWNKQLITQHINPNSNQLFVVWGPAYTWTGITPFSELNYMRDFRTFSLGSFQQSPVSIQFLNHLNINDLWTELVEYNDVFLCVNINQLENLDYLNTYYIEHYGYEIEPQLLLKSDIFNIYRINRK